MSASTAIGRVSESLRSLLLGEMQLNPQVPITILAPDEGGGSRRVNLFLYKVAESAFLRNQEWQLSAADSTRLVPPPLPLNLYYLMTPYADNDDNLGNANAHEILGDAMRVFYEHAIVPDAYLTGDLGSAREQIKITHNSLDIEELSQVWGTFSEPFRLSVLYEVSVVQLDQSTAGERDLPTRARSIGPPQVEAPFRLPSITGLTPTSGPAGTTVTVHGTHLDGWMAYVTLLRQRIVDGLAVTGPSFEVTLPGDLAPGFHQLRIDISNLARQTVFFEVTP